MTRLLLRSGPGLLAWVLFAVLAAGEGWFPGASTPEGGVVTACAAVSASSSAVPAPISAVVVRRQVPSGSWMACRRPSTGPGGSVLRADPHRPRGPPA